MADARNQDKQRISPRVRRWFWIIAVTGVGTIALLAGLAGCWISSLPDDPVLLHERLEDQFEGVETITAKQLKAVMESSAPLVLLDVRSAEEYAVSHLRDAHRVQTVERAREILEKAPADATVVAYCSLGYRSGRLAQDLVEAGYPHVKNLQGSIFHWANEGYPLYREEREVKVVHPYNALWGKWLDKELWKYEPDG